MITVWSFIVALLFDGVAHVYFGARLARASREREAAEKRLEASLEELRVARSGLAEDMRRTPSEGTWRNCGELLWWQRKKVRAIVICRIVPLVRDGIIRTWRGEEGPVP